MKLSTDGRAKHLGAPGLGADGTASVLLVATVGFSQRARASMQLVFENRSVPVELVADPTTCDVVIVDSDTPEGRVHLTAPVVCPRVPVLAVGLDEPHASTSAWIPKPLDVETLIYRLNELVPGETKPAPLQTSRDRTAPAAPSVASITGVAAQEPTRSKFASQRVRVAPRNVAAAAATIQDRVSFRANATILTSRGSSSCLLDLMREAVGSSGSIARPIVLEHRAGIIVVGALPGQVTTSLTADRLRTLARHSSRSTWRVRRLRRSDPCSNAASRGTEAFCWSLGMWTYGAEPPHALWDRPVRLRRWPNLARTAPIDRDMVLSAVWVQQPLTIPDASDLLDIPEPKVAAFASAAYGAGLFASGPESTAPPDSTGPPTHRRTGRRSLLAAVLRRLRS